MAVFQSVSVGGRPISANTRSTMPSSVSPFVAYMAVQRHRLDTERLSEVAHAERLDRHRRTHRRRARSWAGPRIYAGGQHRRRGVSSPVTSPLADPAGSVLARDNRAPALLRFLDLLAEM